MLGDTRDHIDVTQKGALGSLDGITMTPEEMEAIRVQVDSKVAQELHKPAMRSVLQQIQLRRRTCVSPLVAWHKAVF